jgi:hypothetical protein
MVKKAGAWAQARTWEQAVIVLEEAISDTQGKKEGPPIPPAAGPASADGATGSDQGIG